MLKRFKALFALLVVLSALFASSVQLFAWIPPEPIPLSEPIIISEQS